MPRTVTVASEPRVPQGKSGDKFVKITSGGVPPRLFAANAQQRGTVPPAWVPSSQSPPLARHMPDHATAALRSHTKFAEDPRPLPNHPHGCVIGIAGGTASGKSALATRIAHDLGPRHCAVIAQDRYYRDHPKLSPAERRLLDYDHPEAIETALLLRHLRDLRRGRPVELPHYDYARHRRAAETTPINRVPVIIIEGLFVLADPHLRRALDLKVFVHTPDDLRLLRRIKRDTTERGQSLAEVLERYETRARPGHERHVAPSCQHADLVWDQSSDPAFPERLLARLRQTP